MDVEKVVFSEFWVNFGLCLTENLKSQKLINFSTFLKDLTCRQEHLEIRLFTHTTNSNSFKESSMIES